jgi:OOP family OmpA-OmpF porin
MKKHVFAATLMAAGIVAVAGSANAQGWNRDGVYTSVKGAWTAGEDQKYNNTGVKTQMNDGWGGSVAVGKSYGNMRAEIEGLYLTNDVDNAKVNGANAAASGESSLLAGMVNGYYDFKNSTRFTPYVGAGVGYGTVDSDNVRSAGALTVDGNDEVFAYQGIAGASYELNPCWHLTGEYRYVGTTKADIGSTDVRYGNHIVAAGLRYTF